MIPADINVQSIAGELKNSNLTIAPEILVSYGEHKEGMVQHYEDILNGNSTPGIVDNLGTAKIAVLDKRGATSSDMRDVAQALKNETGANTVIVQSHGPAGIVSDTLSRSQIEQKQSLINYKVDPTAAETYINSIEGTETDFTGINALVLTATIGSVVIAATFSRRSLTRGR
ncbi:Rv1476 family membrane protein [Corynebacterium urogenitale]